MPGGNSPAMAWRMQAGGPSGESSLSPRELGARQSLEQTSAKNWGGCRAGRAHGSPDDVPELVVIPIRIGNTPMVAILSW